MPAPSGTTTLSPTRMGEAKLAMKMSPFSFRSEFKVSFSRMARTVPSGTEIFSGPSRRTAEAGRGTVEGTSDDTATAGTSLGTGAVVILAESDVAASRVGRVALSAKEILLATKTRPGTEERRALCTTARGFRAIGVKGRGVEPTNRRLSTTVL